MHPKLIEAMSRPDFYPHRPEQVELIQTHISFIFIAGDRVYKVKKPVDFGFLDFTSLEKRKFYCGEELRLNLRLAPKIYLDVVAITEGKDGALRLDDGGPVVEYAVCMKRLPLERMLKCLILEQKTDPSVMEAVADRLVRFHSEAATGGKIDLIGGVETIRHNHDENFTQTAPYISRTIPSAQYDFIKSYVYEFIEKNEELLKKRVKGGKIRDGHGDLHLEHIVVADEITIFDCIEFNERFRYGDVAAEVAFLAMDLDYNGHPEYAERFVDAYVRNSGDREIPSLLNFYKCYYAYVRGKVVGFRLEDGAIPIKEQKEASRIAARYFDLALRYSAQPGKPLLILVAGLMGTGKSVLARKIADGLGVETLRMDVLRKELYLREPTEHRFEDFGQGLYSDEINKITYEKAFSLASDRLREGRTIVIDASFKKRAERSKAMALADQCNANFMLLECICPDEIIKQRLEARLAEGNDASDGRWEIFQAQKHDFEEINELPEPVHLRMDTTLAPEDCLYQFLKRLKTTK